MVVRIVVGLVLTVAAFALAGRGCGGWSGWPCGQPRRSGSRRSARTRRVTRGSQATEVIGQRKLLAWTIPGLAHAFTFWAFIVLGLTIVEAYGALFRRAFRDRHWAVSASSRTCSPPWCWWRSSTFTVIRLPADPGAAGPGVAVLRVAHRRGVGDSGHDLRGHRDVAGVPRRADQHRRLPLPARCVRVVAGRRAWLHAAGVRRTRYRDVLRAGAAGRRAGVPGVRDLLQAPAHHVGAAQHLFRPQARRAGALLPMYSRGGTRARLRRSRPDDDVFGLGKIEDFTWKGLLDLATCTECGRCQSQCPAWVTDKPLSPKLIIPDLRDHALAKAPLPAGRLR